MRDCVIIVRPRISNNKLIHKGHSALGSACPEITTFSE